MTAEDNYEKKKLLKALSHAVSGSIKGHRSADSNCDVVESGKGGDGAVVMTTVQHNITGPVHQSLYAVISALLPADDDKDSCLLHLMRAFTDVERLRDDNKYYCDQCFRYVEAERSLHYEALPNILTVHLKRFSATG